MCSPTLSYVSCSQGAHKQGVGPKLQLFVDCRRFKTLRSSSLEDHRMHHVKGQACSVHERIWNWLPHKTQMGLSQSTQSLRVKSLLIRWVHSPPFASTSHANSDLTSFRVVTRPSQASSLSSISKVVASGESPQALPQPDSTRHDTRASSTRRRRRRWATKGGRGVLQWGGILAFEVWLMMGVDGVVEWTWRGDGGGPRNGL